MDSLKDMNLMTLMKAFDTAQECRGCLTELRWPKGIECPKCHGKSISTKQARDQYDCNSCRYQFSATSGTIFHDSHLPLPKWFAAIYLMCESRKGISANQLKRTLKVSYKTAWYLCHRIRKAIEELREKPKLQGTVEVDEIYVGGKYDPRRQRGPWEKTPVIGLLERGGKFEARMIPTPSRRVLTGIVNERVDQGANVFTDEYRAYNSLDRTYHHKSVNHSKEEWVRGNVHTNGVESAWSLFKRSVVGAFHHISAKHLDAYFDEFEWRFNNRHNPYLFRDTLIKLVSSAQLEYKELTKTA